MGFAHLFGRYRREARIADVAQQISAGSLEAVWRRIYRRLPELSLAETRGYVRARASLILRRQTAHAVAQQPCLAGCESRLLEQAMEATVSAVLSQWRTMQPASSRALRRAA